MKDTWIEIVKFSVPAILVMIAAYVVMKNFMDNQLNNAKINLKLANQKLITPVRLQAYERLVLFLERITPENLLVRVFQPGMTVQQFHNELLKNIRTEYEHNMSQQVYVSDDAWEAVKNAKESVLRLINTVASSEKGKASVQDFSRIALEAYNSVETNPTETAIEFLKAEIRQQIF